MPVSWESEKLQGKKKEENTKAGFSSWLCQSCCVMWLQDRMLFSPWTPASFGAQENSTWRQSEVCIWQLSVWHPHWRAGPGVQTTLFWCCLLANTTCSKLRATTDSSVREQRWGRAGGISQCSLAQRKWRTQYKLAINHSKHNLNGKKGWSPPGDRWSQVH